MALKDSLGIFKSIFSSLNLVKELRHFLGPNRQKLYNISQNWLKICENDLKMAKTLANLVDVSDILYFFCSGEVGESEATGKGGGRDSIENPREGGGLPEGGGGQGAGRVFAGNLGGGGAKYFFSGPKCPPS